LVSSFSSSFVIFLPLFRPDSARLE
jgi:hypothetical protein